MPNLLTHFAKAMLPFEVRYAARRLNWQRQYALGFLSSSGSKVHCPIAERDFHHFVRLPGGGLMTPSNGAVGRHRVVWLYLERETELFRAGKTLLDVAPERCLMDRFLAAPGLLYLPGDKMARGYGSQAGVRRIDLLALDFPDATFDYLLCNHVLEHLPDDRAAMKEMLRVLEPAGTAILTVPLRDGPTFEDPSVTSPRERERLFGQWDHVRHYGSDIAERLNAVGFRTRLDRYADRFSEAERRRYGLADTWVIRADKP